MTGRPRSYGYSGLAKARLIEELLTVIIAAGVDNIPAPVPPVGSGTWRAGDPCVSCGSTDAVFAADGVMMQAHCNGCGRDDWDDD